MVCTFAGHRQMMITGLSEQLFLQIEQLASEVGTIAFMVGGHGEFDSLCTACVRRLKGKHPHRNISLCLVLPYMTNRLNTEGRVLAGMYDDIIFPSSCEQAHPKAAIVRRNRWMVDQADVVIACVRRDFGGVYQTFRYAQKKGKRVIFLTNGA
ncbi:MAG: DUF1273 domain-containing protein [Clostridia bacterium]|nr:DUF1273 domain-containing protein [Clostridia bacterium]